MSKKFIYALILVSSLIVMPKSQERGYLGSAAGFDVSLVIPEGDLHPTPGWGGLMDFGFGLGPAGQIHMAPVVDFWVSGHDYYHDYHRTVFEMTINGDAKYYPPVPRTSPVKPFGGMGFTPVITFTHDGYWERYRPDYSGNDINFGFNFLGGIDFKMGSKAIGFTELRGKVGGYDLIKFTFGMKFLLGR